jgi:hypothetical protein
MREFRVASGYESCHVLQKVVVIALCFALWWTLLMLPGWSRSFCDALLHLKDVIQSQYNPQDPALILTEVQ